MIAVLVHAGSDTIEGTLLKPADLAGAYVPLTRDDYDRGEIDLDGVYYVRDEEGEILRINGWLCSLEVVG
jgi:hypothetical protein